MSAGKLETVKQMYSFEIKEFVISAPQSINKLVSPKHWFP